jgi:hypothetical protein
MAIESPIEQLRNHLFRTLGLATLPLVAIGCGGRQVSDDEAADGEMTIDDADDQGDGSEDDNEDEGSGSGSSSTSSSTSTTTGDSDTDTETDVDEDPDCEVTYHSLGELEEFPDCALPLYSPLECANIFDLACTPAVDGQTCEEQCPAGICDECVRNPQVADNFGTCGSYLIEGKCCSVIGHEYDCGGGFEGRPFVVAGTQRLAAIEPSIEPSNGASIQAEALPEWLRRHLADHWSRVAAAEHASVASFAQFALRLLALGVPPTLIRDSFAAAGDEVRHAEVALALAARFAGRPLRFGALDVRGAAQQPEDLESLVLACVREGCIGETLASLELATAAASCTDPELAASLQRIADDEARHAGLAWRFVQWALARDPDLRPKVAALFDSLLHPVEIESIDQPQSLDRGARRMLRDHGCLPEDDRRRVEREGLRELLRPCATALLTSTEART